jgi:predicted Zn-dependent peptidase
MRTSRLAAGILAVLIIPFVFSCQKNQRETEKFERADNETFHRDMSDLSSFRLDNGMTVYLQEERTSDQIAIEVLYDVGFMDEPKGLPQLSHVAEHLAIYCGSGSFADDEATNLIQDKHGMVNAETLGDFSHYDYVVTKDHFEDALRVEASRMGHQHCDAATLKREEGKVVGEIDQMMSSNKPVLTKYALMALNQVVNYGATNVPVHMGAKNISLDDATRFHDTYTRPNNAVMVVIGNIKKAEAEALIRKYLGPIPAKPDPPRNATALTHNVRATWDIDASAMYTIVPGPYADRHECLILTMFGAFLQQYFNTVQELYGGNQIVYCSNQVYKVGGIPFFIYVQPSGPRTPADLAPLVQQYLDRALKMLDENDRIDTIKGGIVSFVTSTMLKPDVPDYPMAHHQIIGQEALNVALKHILREGKSTDDFIAEVNAITPDEFRKVVRSRVTPSRMFEVTLTPAH